MELLLVLLVFLSWQKEGAREGRWEEPERAPFWLTSCNRRECLDPEIKSLLILPPSKNQLLKAPRSFFSANWQVSYPGELLSCLQFSNQMPRKHYRRLWFLFYPLQSCSVCPQIKKVTGISILKKINIKLLMCPVHIPLYLFAYNLGGLFHFFGATLPTVSTTLAKKR